MSQCLVTPGRRKFSSLSFSKHEHSEGAGWSPGNWTSRAICPSIGRALNPSVPREGSLGTRDTDSSLQPCVHKASAENTWEPAQVPSQGPGRRGNSRPPLLPRGFSSKHLQTQSHSCPAVCLHTSFLPWAPSFLIFTPGVITPVLGAF